MFALSFHASWFWIVLYMYILIEIAYDKINVTKENVKYKSESYFDLYAKNILNLPSSLHTYH